jgi:hypothetical protein
VGERKAGRKETDVSNKRLHHIPPSCSLFLPRSGIHTGTAHVPQTHLPSSPPPLSRASSSRLIPALQLVAPETLAANEGGDLLVALETHYIDSRSSCGLLLSSRQVLRERERESKRASERQSESKRERARERESARARERECVY